MDFFRQRRGEKGKKMLLPDVSFLKAVKKKRNFFSPLLFLVQRLKSQRISENLY